MSSFERFTCAFIRTPQVCANRGCYWHPDFQPRKRHAVHFWITGQRGTAGKCRGVQWVQTSEEQQAEAERTQQESRDISTALARPLGTRARKKQLPPEIGPILEDHHLKIRQLKRNYGIQP